MDDDKRTWAMIRNGRVEFCCLANAEWIDTQKPEWDYCVEIFPNVPGAPGKGDFYDGEVFTPGPWDPEA